MSQLRDEVTVMLNKYVAVEKNIHCEIKSDWETQSHCDIKKRTGIY